MQQAIAVALSARSRRHPGDAVFAAVAKLSGLFVLLLLGSLIVTLFVGGLPAFRRFGLGFLVSDDWDPVKQVFGALVPIYGTLLPRSWPWCSRCRCPSGSPCS